jgi:hypothetical protein
MASNKLSQRQIVATITKESDFAPGWGTFMFAQVSGGEITAAVEKVYEGGRQFPTVLCAPYEIGDVTLTAHMDDSEVVNDASGEGVATKLAVLRTYVGRAYYTVNVHLTDCDIKVQGSDRIYAQALLVGITEPEGDASSGAPATFSLTFALQGVVSNLEATLGATGFANS